MKIHVIVLNIGLLLSTSYMRAESAEINNTENQTLLNELKTRKERLQAKALETSKAASNIENIIATLPNTEKSLALTRKIFDAICKTEEGQSLFNDLLKSMMSEHNNEAILYKVAFLLPLFTEQQANKLIAEKAHEYIAELDTRIKQEEIAINSQIIADQNKTN